MEILSSKVTASARVGEQPEEGQAARGSCSTVPQKPALPGRASSRNLPSSPEVQPFLNSLLTDQTLSHREGPGLFTQHVTNNQQGSSTTQALGRARNNFPLEEQEKAM